MKKPDIYLSAGSAWLACCIYQLKNHNMFMTAASAAVTLLCFILAVYQMYANKDSESNDHNKTGV